VGKKLVVHIGLPKTATTSVQTHFFPQVAGYLGSRHSSIQVDSQGDGPTEAFGEFTEIHDAYCKGQDWDSRLSDWAHNLDFSEQPVRVISYENLARWSSPPKVDVSQWPVGRAHQGDVPRTGAPPVTVFLAKLKDVLPSDVSLFTIVTLRNQADFLGSLAAQLGARGAVIDRVIHREDAFVDFYLLVTELEKVSGPPQHLTLLFEDGVEHNCKKIVEFAGLTPLKEGFNFEPGKAQGVKRTGNNTWRADYAPSYPTWGIFLGLRKVVHWGFPRLVPAMKEINRFVIRRMMAVGGAFGQTVSISDGDRLKLQVHCEPSNQRLAEHLKRDLASLGY